MKQALGFIILALSSSAANAKDIFNGAKTRETPILIDYGYGDEIQIGEFISLMEQPLTDRRNLQTTGEGFGNDPTACSTSGSQFTCVAPSGYTVNGTVTNVINTVTCELDSQIGMDFQRSQNCQCNAELTSADGEQRSCMCITCPRGSTQSVALNCSNWVQNPWVLGPCTSLSCDGRCNGTGAVVVNQPTPSPGGETPPPEASGAVGYSIGCLSLAVLVGAAASFVSVYMA